MARATVAAVAVVAAVRAEAVSAASGDVVVEEVVVAKCKVELQIG